MKYTTQDLRKLWLDFWKSKNHVIIPSSGVIPENDPSALFHNSGMHPLVPFLMGEDHPAGTRLANVQKCIRTGDIDEVGDKTHLTFFEMLGNWSLGDYFKTEQIQWSFEFLTQVLNIPIEKLAVSVFAGDKDAPRDNESFEIWKKCGIPENRIAFLGKEDNWWSKGDVGPCGPDTEMFYWTGTDKAPDNFQDTCTNPHWVEIWNDVFMQFNKDEKGILTPLPQKNIDTGMGLERTVAVLNGLSSIYQTDAFTSILQKIAELSGNQTLATDPLGTTEAHTSARILADHLRSAAILLGDRIAPSNTDQGYILRRLIRRAIRHGKKLNIDQKFCSKIVHVAIKNLSNTYSELTKNENFIIEELEREEHQFGKTLHSGEKEFRKMIDKSPDCVISGTIAFHIYETYGFPLEMIVELAKELGKTVDTSAFESAFQSHQKKSREGAEKKFSGGLADHSQETVKLHTATHLLHAALRKVLGPHVEQRGSNITPERLRFDFSHPDKMTPEQITEVEKYVNDAIASNAPVTCKETTVDQAKAENAIGLFEDKYGDKVKLYTMGEFSKEICGGPHVEHLGVLKSFKIKKEQSASQGIRRIKAVVGK